MSNQLVITSGAKVRSLEGVITGSTGVLNSLPINGSNGIPQLDSNGKILVSQLPNSVMEYKGTWDAATNTPTLADGTGNQGDVYLCNVAGTVNFGAGPITFYVGDQVIYSGTIWQRASGASGTVTSVAVTETGDALSITGSPIVNSGTINIGFAGTSAQYVAGDGSLITFPTTATAAQNLITEVYNETGATLTKGTVVYINGGHGNLPTVTKAIATGDSTSAQTYGVVRADITNMNNGFVTVIGSLGDLDTQAYAAGTQLYLSSTTAGAWTSTKQYAPAHLVYVGIVVRSHPTQGVVEIRIQNGFELDELHNVSAQTPSNNQGLFYNSSNSLWENKSIATALGYTPANDSLVVHLAGSETITGTKFFDTPIALNNALNLKFDVSINAFGGYYSLYAIKGSGSANSVLAIYDGDTNKKSSLTFDNTNNYIYTFPSASGTIALTSDIPSLSGYVPYTGATALLNLGTYNLKANNIYAEGNGAFAGGGLLIKQYSSGVSSISGYNTISSQTSAFFFSSSLGGSYKNFLLDPSGLTNATTRSYTLPDASGTLALTSDIPSLSATAPISYSGGVISISQATTSTSGYLSSTDWNTFNNKIATSGTIPNGTIVKYSSGSLVASDILNSTPGFVAVSAALYVTGTIIKAGGTSAEFLKADGSVDSNTYLTTSSAASTYLPLSGGTLTGALNGTSATFSSNVQLTGDGYVYGNATAGSGTIRAGIRFNSTSQELKFFTADAGRLTIDSSGAATFSSSVTATSATFSSTNGYLYLNAANSGGNEAGIFYQIGGSNKWENYTAANDTALNWYSYGNSTVVFKLASTGAATFSSSVGIGAGLNVTGYTNSSSGNYWEMGSDASGYYINALNRSSGNYNLPAYIDAQKLIINSGSGGNVGIGTSSPSQPLHVYSSGNTTSTYFETSSANSYIGLKSTSGVCYIGNVGYALTFEAGGSERMRITSGGNVLIGTTTSSAYALMALKSSTTATTWGFGPNISGSLDIFRVETLAGTGVYLTSGNTSWTANSDERLKNITGNIENAVDKLCTLRTVEYTWKKDKTNKVNLGLIAQDVLKVLPEVVDIQEDEINTLGVKYTELVPVLIAAIQEQQQQIEELKLLIATK